MLWLALAFAALNCFRGRGIVPGDRWIACLGMGLAAGLYAWSWQIGLAVAVGTFIWALPKWGAYFSAITGRISDAKGIGWVDAIVDAVFPLPRRSPGWATWQIRARGMLGMTLRSLYTLPLFVALAALTGNPHALLGSVVCLLQGPCYWLVGCFGERKWSVAAAEILFGAVLGFSVALAVVV